LGLCPLPGRGGQYVQDLAALADFAPQLVLSLVEIHEYQRHNAPTLPADLAALTIEHLHLPIRDFGTPKPGLWPAVGPRLHAALDQGGRVAIHCLAGCGRTGMIALRLMIEAGESPAAALLRLRAARPCAVETKAQQRWAEAP
jgi:protein-tyrosine phosphatase